MKRHLQRIVCDEMARRDTQQVREKCRAERDAMQAAREKMDLADAARTPTGAQEWAEWEKARQEWLDAVITYKRAWYRAWQG